VLDQRLSRIGVRVLVLDIAILSKERLNRYLFAREPVMRKTPRLLNAHSSFLGSQPLALQVPP